jgi:hypothetical protein
VGRVAGNASRGGERVESPPIDSFLVLKYLTLGTKIAFVVEVWELMCREMMEDATLLRLKVLSLLALLRDSLETQGTQFTCFTTRLS